EAARSTPRWPLNQRSAGGLNGRITRGGEPVAPTSGHRHTEAARGCGGGAPERALAGIKPAEAVASTSANMMRIFMYPASNTRATGMRLFALVVDNFAI